MRKFWTMPKRVYEKGQALAEYSIIVALVAIASIAVVTLFGNQIRSLFSGSARQLAGQEAAKNEDVSGGAAGEVGKQLDNW